MLRTTLETNARSRRDVRPSQTVGGQITRLLTDHRAKSFSQVTRRRRWEMLAARFPNLSEMRVLDVGGLADTWLDSPLLPRELVLLNVPSWEEEMVEAEDQIDPRIRVRNILGDACNPPENLTGEHFDLVYCNSVIEHVGGHQRRVELANAIHRLGEHHWVQTPYRFFPIEPHTLMPGLQFLPLAARARAMRRWPIGNMRRYDTDWPQTEVSQADLTNDLNGSPLREIDPRWAVLGVQSIELLSNAEMRAYFPGSEIVTEKVLGLTKSLIAVR